MLRSVLLATALIITGPVVSAHADEVEDAIKEALEAYQNEDRNTARQQLSYAVQLIGQQAADALGKVLPDALSGWEAEDVESNSAGLAMLGGGIQAKRAYTKGDDRVEIQVIGDSPLLSQFMALMSNPAMAAAMGSKPTKINGQMALVDSDGKISMVIANRFLVTVEGSASSDDKTAYAKAIDLKKPQSL